MHLPIYMDCHATTPTDPRVFKAMAPYFTERFGNPSSRTHRFGWEAEKAVDRARRHVAALIGARAKEIVFTSGATESDNHAIKGVAEAYCDRGRHIITSVIEHRAVLASCRRLEKLGFKITYLTVGKDGRVDPNDVRRSITSETILISVMTANSEIGVIQPIAEIGRIAKKEGILFHTDAVQAVGRVPFNVGALSVDLASITAHKMYGPKGVGALYVRRKRPSIRLTPIIDGGEQQDGLRSGTLNVPSIVGFGEAARLCLDEMSAEQKRVRSLRDHLLDGLQENISDLRVNGSMCYRLPNNLNVSFPGITGESLVMGVSDVAMSTGSACASGSDEPSHVLTALGISRELARASIRLGLGRFNDIEQVNYAIQIISRAANRLRELSPVYESGSVGTNSLSGEG